jgi:hypothetical protein
MLLHEFQLASIDEKLREERLNLISLQRDPMYSGPRRGIPEAEVSTVRKIGAVKFLRFYDKKTRCFQKKVGAVQVWL